MGVHPYYVAHISVLLASSFIGFLLLLRVWNFRSLPGAYGLILAILCAVEWSLAYVMEIVRLDMAEKIFWGKLQYFGISYVALGMFIFTINYSGRGAWLTSIRKAWLAILASVGFVATLTNDWHHQIWTDIQFTDNLAFGPLQLTHGILFYFVVAVQYILLISVTVIFFQVALRGQSLYRIQSSIMLIGMSFPWMANLVYVMGWYPFPGIDITPIALTFSAIALSISFLRYRFMDMLPVAHDSVFKAMKDGVIVLDHKDRVVDINPMGAQIFQQYGNLLGSEVASLFPDWKKWKGNDPQGDIHQEIFINLAGETLTFKLRVTPILEQHVGRDGHIILISNITEQKKAQEQLMEASRLKSQLLANLGHDLRSPLGAIIGYAEMLEDGSFGPMSNEQVKATSEILDGANQLLSFINNLVGQAQIETGRVVLREYPFNVEEVIGPLLSTLNFHARKKGLTLVQFIDPTLPRKLVGDQFWLRQIVMNLVHNAVKFTDKGSVTVRFIVKNDDEWAVQVMDTGIGIPPEAQKRVFQAFEQINSMENSKQSGFGLGLSIVAKLTSIMNGKIELTSEAGKGSTFTVILPLKEVVEQEGPVMFVR